MAGAAALGIGGIGALFKGVTDEKRYREQMDDLTKGLGDLTRNTLSFADTWKAAFDGLGMNTDDISATAKVFHDLAGAADGAKRSLKDVHRAVMFGRGYGLDPAQSARFFGSMRRLGGIGDMTAESVHNAGPYGMIKWRSPTLNTTDMAATLGAAISEGGMFGRIEELLESIEGLTEEQTRTLLKPADMKGMITWLTAFNASGFPGLKGTLGAQVLGQLGHGIQNPGGGEYGQYAMYQWLGGGDYFGFKYKQEEGLAHAGEAIQGFKRNFGHLDPMAQRYYFSKLFGTTMHQSEGVLKSFDQLGGLAGYGDMAAQISAWEGRTGKSFDFRKIGLITELYHMKQGGSASPESIEKLLKDSRVNLKPDEMELAKRDIGAAINLALDASTVKTDAEAFQETGAKIDKTLSDIGGKILDATQKMAEFVEKIYGVLPWRAKAEWEQGMLKAAEGIDREKLPNLGDLGIGGRLWRGEEESGSKVRKPIPKHDQLSAAYGANGLIAGHDITRYATDPNHEARVARLYSKASQHQSAEEIDAYIQKNAPGSPVTGSMVLSSAQRYNVDPGLVLALMQQDSTFGTRGKGARSHNPGNVGNDDTGRIVDYGSWEAGVDQVSKWLNKHRVGGGQIPGSSPVLRATEAETKAGETHNHQVQVYLDGAQAPVVEKSYQTGNGSGRRVIAHAMIG